MAEMFLLVLTIILQYVIFIYEISKYTPK